MYKSKFFLLISAIFATLPLAAFADPGDGLGCYGSGRYQMYGPGGMMGSSGNYMLGYGWILPMLFWTIIVIGAAALVAFLVKGQKAKTTNGVELPVDILKKRFAQGEINKDEFEQMKKEIDG
jgi:putative membrane protein